MPKCSQCVGAVCVCVSVCVCVCVGVCVCVFATVCSLDAGCRRTILILKLPHFGAIIVESTISAIRLPNRINHDWSTVWLVA